MGTKTYHKELPSRPTRKVMQKTCTEYGDQLQKKDTTAATEVTKKSINEVPSANQANIKEYVEENVKENEKAIEKCLLQRIRY